MSTTVRIPLQLLTVSMANGNAYWQAKDGTNFDFGCVSFVDAATGDAYYHGLIPHNMNATENWDLVLHHGANGGSGGNVILDISALDFADGATIDSALTTIATDKSLATGTAGLLQIDLVNGSALDGTEGLTAGNWLIVKISRDGGNGSDTVGDVWNLYGVYLQIDVD